MTELAKIIAMLCFIGLGYILGRLHDPEAARQIGIRAAHEEWDRLMKEHRNAP